MKKTPLFAIAIALGLILPATGLGSGAKAVAASPTPTPLPSPTAAPALPYPAYGTPAPGIATVKAVPGVPQHITLGQAIDIAVAKAPAMATARAQVELAQANVRLARVPELPSLSATGTTQHTNNASSSQSLGTGGTVTRGGSFTSNSLNANLRQLIFDGGRVANQIRAASESEIGSVDNLKRSLQTTAFNVAQAYYNALQAHRATLLAVEIVRQNQVQENLVAAQIRAGTAAQSDLATAQFPTAQARVSLVKAQGTEISAYATFANTIGLDADTDVEPIDDTPANPNASLLQAPLLTYDAAIIRAVALRPDYDAADRSVRSARDSLRAARLGLFPSLVGNGSYGVASTNAVGGDFRSSNSIGAALSIPIYDQGMTGAQSAQAQANLDIASANFQNTFLGIQLNVRQALANLVSAQAALDQTQAELSKAVVVLRATQAQYRAGVTTLPLLLNAQVAITQAQTDHLTAIYALRQAEQNYLYALGENDLAAAT
ncbi:MAG: TolC family protein [Candidatus Eremiobacteraeota bacterium]|nr:TolC family protein [Candidatus Eremiobacteraeota bacterium]